MKGKILKEKDIRGKKIYVFMGDITEMEVDAIVNAANEYLKHGGGVAGAIVRKGGKIIQEESDKIGYCPVGEAVVTGAGNLKAKFVIHAVGPKGEEKEGEEKLKRAVKNALKRGEEKNISSIAIPAISTGIFGFPKEKGTQIIVEKVKEFLEKEAKSIKEVYLCDINEETCKFFEKFL